MFRWCVLVVAYWLLSCQWTSLKEPWLHFLWTFLSDICAHWWDPPESSLGLTVPALSDFHQTEMLQALHHFNGPSLHSLSNMAISLILLSRGAGSLPWLAAALLMQARVPLAFFAARAHYWFMCSLVTTRSFPASCFPAMWPTVCGCSFPGAGFYTSLRWTSLSSEGWYC